MAALEKSLAKAGKKKRGKAADKIDKHEKGETRVSAKASSKESGDAKHIQIEDRRLRLTNLEKVLYPKVEFTKPK